MLPAICTLHGVFMNICNIGTLITGPSNSGKSELALSLIDRGYQLIADDAPEFYVEKNQLMGRCPSTLQDFLEVRGLGIINVRNMFGDQTVLIKKSLDLIINLTKIKTISGTQRLQGIQDQQFILNFAIPVITIPRSSNRNLALLTECAVKIFKTKSTATLPVERNIVITDELSGF